MAIIFFIKLFKGYGYDESMKNKYLIVGSGIAAVNAFGIALFSMGIIDEERSDTVITDGEEDLYRKVSIKDDRIVGALVIGDTKRSPVFKKAIEEEIKLNGFYNSRPTVEEVIKFLKNREV